MRRRSLLGVLGGAAAFWPIAALAQKVTPVIGFLGSSAAAMATMQLEGFRQGLSDQGFVRGKDLEIEFRWAEGHYDRLAALAADLVSRNVDVIVAQAPPAARAAKTATATSRLCSQSARTLSPKAWSPVSHGREATSPVSVSYRLI